MSFTIQEAPSIDLHKATNIRDIIETQGIPNVKNSNEVSIPYVIVQGTVEPLKNSIESQYEKGVKGVIREFTILEHVRKYGRSGFWLDSTKTIQHTSNSVPFSLNHKVQVRSKFSEFKVSRVPIIDP